MSNTHNTDIVTRLRKEMYFSNGRNEAFIFAVNCGANIEHIQREMEDVKQRIYDRLQDATSQAMAEGSSPRIYQDGYLSGLEDALVIISKSRSTAES